MYSSSGSSRYRSVRSAAIETRLSANAPSWSPKKLEIESQYVPSPIKKRKRHIPPNHDSESLNPLQVQRLSIILIPPTIRSPKIAPFDENRLTALSAEIKFPAYRTLFSTIGTLGENLILQCESVELAVCTVDDQFNAVVRGEIPCSLFASCTLRSETGTAEGLDVEGSVELGDQGRGGAGEFGLGGAATDAVVGGGPVVLGPGAGCRCAWLAIIKAEKEGSMDGHTERRRIEEDGK